MSLADITSMFKLRSFGPERTELSHRGLKCKKRAAMQKKSKWKNINYSKMMITQNIKLKWCQTEIPNFCVCIHTEGC